MADNVIDYYYTLVSPWTYIGDRLLHQMAEKYGAGINHMPVDLGAVFQVSGGLPLPKRPVQRRAYRLVELQRWHAYRGVELNLHPKFFPADATLGCLMVTAAQRDGLDAGALSYTCLHAVWAEDRNIADPATLKAIADTAGMDGAALLAAAETPDIRAIFDARTEEAKERQVFGAPTYIYRGEPFWGQDRLEMLERALSGEVAPVPIEKIE
jgi:2-hydroxychromene-2-carboxylate isomerase